MSKFIVGSFLILGWTFYEMSGGSDFVPQERVIADAEVEVVEEPVAVVAALDAPIVSEPVVTVTRAANPNLLDVSAGSLTENVANVATAVAEQEDAVADVLANVVVDEPVVEEVATPELDIRLVAGSRVNMRSGPGTNYAVLETLPGGTEAEVIEVDQSGWARIRIADTGVIGWMAERLLTES